jgi:hypothetical protein
MSQRIYHTTLHAIIYVPKMTKAAIQAAAINASAQSPMVRLFQPMMLLARPNDKTYLLQLASVLALPTNKMFRLMSNLQMVLAQ